MNLIEKLNNKGLISPPRWLPNNVIYLTLMGSEAYGVTSNDSDRDIYGIVIPPKRIIFPHLQGVIVGFGKHPETFNQYQKHNINVPDEKKTYDVSIYNIVRYFQLCMECNPNMIDSLFTPRHAVLFSTQVAELIRENRKLFLHKGAWHRFKGYAYSQVHKIKNKENRTGKRKYVIEEFGYDVKFAYHAVRLLDEISQILQEGTLDLTRNREMLKSVRRGEWTEERFLNWFYMMEEELERLQKYSKLPEKPNEAELFDLLTTCLTMHYGSLDNDVVVQDKAERAIKEITNTLRRYGY